MKIAIPIWGNRISPVFDSAATFMIVEVRNLKIINRKFEKFDPTNKNQISSIFANYHIGTLICGAITDVHAKSIEQNGVKLISFITGNADEVLVTYLKKPHGISDFSMPGAFPGATGNKKLGFPD